MAVEQDLPTQSSILRLVGSVSHIGKQWKPSRSLIGIVLYLFIIKKEENMKNVVCSLRVGSPWHNITDTVQYARCCMHEEPLKVDYSEVCAEESNGQTSRKRTK